MKEFKYTTSFSSVIKALIPEDKDKYLAMASLVDIGDFIPDVDHEKNIDLLPVAFNAFVANRVNKNGDVIDTATAMDIYKNFINKPINIEHNRDKVIGTILTAGFSEFGTDKPLTEEQVKELNGPFNVTLGGVIWKVVNNNLAKLIEEASDPTSEDFNKISASWELGFSEYKLAVIKAGSKNLEDAQIIEDSDVIAELEPHLRSLGGSGELEDGRNIYRQVINEVIPLGIGLTETPAAEVEGVHTKKAKKEEILESSENNISQKDNNNVKNNTSKAMKITKLEDITEESVKVLEASAVSDFIQEQLRTASEQFSTEKKRFSTELNEANEKHEALEKEHAEVKERLDKVQATLHTLEAEKAAKEAEEKFTQRMSAMDEEFKLEDEERELIASDIKDMGDEDFSAYQEKLNVLMKHRSREVVEANERQKAEEEAKATEAAKAEEVVEASAEDVIEDAIENAEPQEDDLPNSIEASEPTIYEKYKAAFAVDQFNIK